MGFTSGSGIQDMLSESEQLAPSFPADAETQVGAGGSQIKPCAGMG